MKSWTVAHRITAIVGLFSLTLISFGSFAAYTRSRVQVGGPYFRQIDLSKDLVADILPPPAYIIEAYLLVFQIANSDEATVRADLISRLTAAESQFEERQAFWTKALPASEMKTALTTDAAQPARDFFRVIHERLLPAVARGDLAEARALVNDELSSTYTHHRQAIDAVVTLANQFAQDNERQAKQAVQASAWWELTIGMSGLIAIVALTMLVVRQLNRTLRAAALELDHGAEQNFSASAQVAATSQRLATGSSEQSASLEETSASLEELAASAKGNAEASARAKTLANEARTAADRNAIDLRQMTDAMREIRASSDEVANIVRTIDEIAFQTNILALNAAVEAARAGETGRGFLVVADEVRALAQRSAEASKETAGKIETAVATASRGMEMSSRVSAGLNAITVRIREVDRLVSEVASGSKEQNENLQQINRAVAAMDKVVQSNAAAVEEGAAAAEELSQQAGALVSTVSSIHALVDRRDEIRKVSLATQPKPMKSYRAEVLRRPPLLRAETVIESPAESLAVG